VQTSIKIYALEELKFNHCKLMSVMLRKRKNADGATSLGLDIYNNGKRTIETLKHLRLARVSNLKDRESNKNYYKKLKLLN
jgi:integrase/recombinase XerD